MKRRKTPVLVEVDNFNPAKINFDLFDQLADSDSKQSLRVDNLLLNHRLTTIELEKGEFSNTAHRIRHDVSKIAALNVDNLIFLLKGNKDIMEDCKGDLGKLNDSDSDEDVSKIEGKIEDCAETVEIILGSLDKSVDPIKEYAVALDRVLNIFDGKGDAPALDDVKVGKIFKTVEACIKEMEIEKLNIEIKPDLSEEEIFTDFRKVRDAVVNLISNSKESGADEIKVAVSEDNGNVIIEIEDNGKGIPEEDLSNVLSTEKFTTKGNVSSHGYGVQSVIINIETALEGSFELVKTSTDEKNHGTNFKLTIPKNKDWGGC